MIQPDSVSNVDSIYNTDSGYFTNILDENARLFSELFATILSIELILLIQIIFLFIAIVLLTILIYLIKKNTSEISKQMKIIVKNTSRKKPSVTVLNNLIPKSPITYQDKHLKLLNEIKEKQTVIHKELENISQTPQSDGTNKSVGTKDDNVDTTNREVEEKKIRYLSNSGEDDLSIILSDSDSDRFIETNYDSTNNISSVIANEKIRIDSNAETIWYREFFEIYGEMGRIHTEKAAKFKWKGDKAVIEEPGIIRLIS